MNIIILHSSSDLYGASKVLLVVSKTYIENGHTVTVVLSEEGSLAKELRLLQADVHIIQLGILRKKYYSLTGIINRGYILANAFFALRKLVKQKKTDLIYSNTLAVLIGAFVAKSTGKKHIWHVHEIIEKPKILFNFLGWSLSHFCDKAIVVSTAVFNHWKKKVPAEKLQLIYNGFDYTRLSHPSPALRNELSIPENKIIIATVGRIHYWKGQNYFLEIAASLSKKYSHLEFLIVGDVFPGYEYLYTELNQLIESFGLQQSVHFLGFRKDILSLYPSFDIFLLPSLLPDPFPTVILEAMAAGIPVVATQQGGAVEMLQDGVTGILIPIGDPAKAANRMESLINDKEIRNRMGAMAKERVETEFSLAAFQEAMIKLVQ